MEECKELLYNDPKKLEDREECFLSIEHYYRAKVALTFEPKRLGEYVWFNTASLLNFIYVLGIDDTTGKIFSRRVNVNPKLAELFLNELDPAEEVLRIIMGFTHHKWEVNDITSGQVIRLQGDLAMRVEQAFPSLDEMFNYLWSNFQCPLWREFVMKHANDEELRKILGLIDVWNEIRMYGNEVDIDGSTITYRLMPIKGDTKIYDRLYSISIELGRTIKEMLKEREVPTIDMLYLKRVNDKREEFKKFVLGKEERLNLKYGHYLSPHLVQIVGVLSPSDNMRDDQRDVRILVLREQEITITHEEHGITKFKINRPAIVQFGTLDQFIPRYMRA